MKTNLLLICVSLAVGGCSTVAFYPNGTKAVQTYSDSTRFAFNGGGISLTADTINNSKPTHTALAGTNKIVATVGSAAVAALIPGSTGAAVAAKTGVSVIPHVAPALTVPTTQP